MEKICKRIRPTSHIKLVSIKRKEAMVDSAGAWKNTELDSDKLWKEVFKRKSKNYLLSI